MATRPRRSPRCWPPRPRGPITIADGHHRYETALRYRDERRMTRSCEEDPAFDYLLMLFLDAARGAADGPADPPHRRWAGRDRASRRLLTGLERLFSVRRDVSAAELRERFGAAGLARGGEGRFGLWTRAGGALLTARRMAFEPFLPTGGDALRGLDVTLLGVALERLAGIDAEAVAAGAVAYTQVRGRSHRPGRRRSRWRGCRLPARADARSPRSRRSPLDGDVMPQKSTYFYPKALTGLVINPLEW